MIHKLPLFILFFLSFQMKASEFYPGEYDDEFSSYDREITHRQAGCYPYTHAQQKLRSLLDQARQAQNKGLIEKIEYRRAQLACIYKHLPVPAKFIDLDYQPLEGELPMVYSIDQIIDLLSEQYRSLPTDDSRRELIRRRLGQLARRAEEMCGMSVFLPANLADITLSDTITDIDV